MQIECSFVYMHALGPLGRNLPPPLSYKVNILGKVHVTPNIHRHKHISLTVIVFAQMREK